MKTLMYQQTILPPMPAPVYGFAVEGFVRGQVGAGGSDCGLREQL